MVPAAVHKARVLAVTRNFPIRLGHEKQLEFQDAIEPEPGFSLGAPEIKVGPDDSAAGPSLMRFEAAIHRHVPSKRLHLSPIFAFEGQKIRLHLGEWQ